MEYAAKPSVFVRFYHFFAWARRQYCCCYCDDVHDDDDFHDADAHVHVHDDVHDDEDDQHWFGVNVRKIKSQFVVLLMTW